jgi:hypothetical protein
MDERRDMVRERCGICLACNDVGDVGIDEEDEEGVVSFVFMSIWCVMCWYAMRRVIIARNTIIILC